MGAELGGDDVADRRRGLFRRIAVAVPELAEQTHRRNGRKALAEALHAPAFVVHANWQRRLALPLDIRGELRELLGIFVVAREQDHRARRRVTHAAAIFVDERGAEHVHHHRPRRQPYFSHSRMTVAKATPFSSESETCAEVMPRFFSRAPSASENSSTG